MELQQSLLNLFHRIGVFKIQTVEQNDLPLKRNYITYLKINFKDRRKCLLTFLFYLYRINFLIKFFNILISLMISGDNFLELLHVLLISLVGLLSQRLISDNMLFELICAKGRIYNEIQKVMDDKKVFKEQLKDISKCRLEFHTTHAVLACLSYMFQHFSSLSSISFPFQIIIALHELMFIGFVWILYGWITFLATSFSEEMRFCLQTLNVCLMGNVDFSLKPNNSNNNNSTKAPDIRIRMIEVKLDEAEPLILEYKKLLIVTHQWNHSVGNRILGPCVLSGAQVLINVILMMHHSSSSPTIEEEEEHGFHSEFIIFTIETVMSIYLLVKILESLAQVSAATKDFLHGAKSYLTTKRSLMTPKERKLLKRSFHSLKPFSMSIGLWNLDFGFIRNILIKQLFNYCIYTAIYYNHYY